MVIKIFQKLITGGRFLHYISLYIYIYISIERERERER